MVVGNLPARKVIPPIVGPGLWIKPGSFYGCAFLPGKNHIVETDDFLGTIAVVHGRKSDGDRGETVALEIETYLLPLGFVFQ